MEVIDICRKIKEFANKTKTAWDAFRPTSKNAYRFPCMTLLLAFWFLYQHKNSRVFSIFLCFLKMSGHFLHKSGRPMDGVVEPFLTPKRLFWAATSGALPLPILQPKIGPKNWPKWAIKEKNKPKIVTQILFQIIHQNRIIETRHKKAKQGTKTAIYFY